MTIEKLSRSRAQDSASRQANKAAADTRLPLSNYD